MVETVRPWTSDRVDAPQSNAIQIVVVSMALRMPPACDVDHARRMSAGKAGPLVLGELSCGSLKVLANHRRPAQSV